MWICVRSKDAQKQLALTSLSFYLQRFSFHIFFSTQLLRKVCIANRDIGQFCLK